MLPYIPSKGTILIKLKKSKTKFVDVLTKLWVSRRFQPAIYTVFSRGIRIRGPKHSNPAGTPQNLDFKISKVLSLNPIRGLYFFLLP